MTPINLMFALQARIESVVKDYRGFRESDSKKFRAPRVWVQHLPEKLYDNKQDPADYPFVLIFLGSGDVNEQLDGACAIEILVRGYDDGQPVKGDADEPDQSGLSGEASMETVKDRQGWLIPAEIMWRIICDLEQEPTVGKMYALQHPLTWELPEVQPAPLWHGQISTTFSIPVPQKSYLMDWWRTLPTVPREGPYAEEIKTFLGGD